MSEPTLYKVTPLVWLRVEIDRSIDAARRSVSQALERRNERETCLTEGATEIRRVRGALDMLGLEGASRFCSLLEEALHVSARGTTAYGEPSASTLDRAMFALHQFLSDIAQGEPDISLKLFPVYKEVGELCGRPVPREAELFFPDVGSAAIALEPRTSAIHPSTRPAHLTACCTLFQRGLVAWFRQTSRQEGIGMLRSALDGMHRACDGTESHPNLWWAAAGLVDVLGAADPAIDPAHARTTLGRIERAMRAVSAGSVIDGDALMREILYPIALAQPVTERVLDIQSRYRLDAHIPEFCVSGTLEYDIGALAPVLDEMRSLLGNVEQAWSRYAAGAPDRLPDLRHGLAQLKATARDLGHYRLVRLLDLVTMIVSKLPEAATAQNEGLSLEMAAVFLFMEGMLDHFTDPPHDIDQQVAVMAGWLLDAVKARAGRAMSGMPRDDVTQRQQVAEIRTQVVTEIQENLLRIEEIIEQVARDDAPADRIASMEKSFAQVAGALKMLGLNRANGVLSASTHLLRLCASGEPELKEATLEWAADGLSCLGFYLDALRRGLPPNEDLLLDFVRRLANDSAAPAGSTGWIPAVVDPATPESPAEEPLGEAAIAPVTAARLLVDAIDEGSAEAATNPAGHDRTEGDESPDAPSAVRGNDAAGEAGAPCPPYAEQASGSEALTIEAPSEAPAATNDDVLDLSLLPVFLDEARLLLARLYGDLAAWRNAPRELRGARAYARTLHTLKGSARLIGAMRLGDFTHSVESYVCEAIERAESDAEAVDFAPLQQMLSSIAEHVRRLEALREGGVAAGGEPTPSRQQPPVQAEILDAPSTVRVPIAVLNGLVNHAGELSEVRARTEDEMGTLRRSLHELAETVTRLRAQLREVDKETDRLAQSVDAPASRDPETSAAAPENERVTRLQELSRAVAETLYDVQTLQQGLVVNCAETEAALALQGRLDRNLRHKLLEVRSLPFGSLTERLHRTVRQTAAQLEREAILHIEGENVHIDRTVLQRLAAPLEHMLRNAVAHGIEAPAVRIGAGKCAVGTIRLVIEQNDDENVLTLSDDGAGLDMALIRAQAVQLGLVRPEDTLSERMLFSLIFAPGLSTAKTLTASAGRGVGLDVVRAEIRALGGSIEVSSERARGVWFRIRFPKSLSYTQALLVRSGSVLYAVPATLVEQVCELPADVIRSARESGRLAIGEKNYRYADLSGLLGSRGSVASPRRANSVLLLHGDGEPHALHVEQVLRKQAIELKNIGPQLARVRGIAGATIIGKGDVVLILDPDELVMHAEHRLARDSREYAPGASDAPPIALVVDDSLTMRRATARLLARAGYRVLVARDGVDALAQIEETLPDIVIADIEMPNMDGFELTSHLRSDPRTERIPIVIVTSRIAEKHQKRAADLGVDVFFGKPYAEEKLLADVAELLDRRAQDAAA